MNGQKELKICRCAVCGNIVLMINDSGVTPVCCGRPMTVLTPNTTDAAFEKHVPAVTVRGCETEIRIGNEDHPMTDAHFIEWIMLVTECRIYTAYLSPDEEPAVSFTLGEEERAALAYAYCNLHGLWLKRLCEDDC